MPYAAANYIVDTPDGPVAGADGCRRLGRPPDPNDPGSRSGGPDTTGGLYRISQVTDWMANYDETPGGSGSLQYTVTNTGTATAPAGAYVALVVSRDPTFTSSNSLVVYEPIPFDDGAGNDGVSRREQ